MNTDSSSRNAHRIDEAAGLLMARHAVSAHDAYGLVMDEACVLDQPVAVVVDGILGEIRDEDATKR
ncbi:hypothetical protein [Actinomycetospora flava]|uniref:ANTAR domain-containing protein n=1 Tax=Actinomycetospora flava TaxID=3129232 RepID=A0ABU8M7T6_9PSEU